MDDIESLIFFQDSAPGLGMPKSESDVITASEESQARSLELMLGIVAAAVSIVATIGITVYKYNAIKKQKNETAEIMAGIKEQASKPKENGGLFNSTRIRETIAKGVEEGVAAATVKSNSSDRGEMIRKFDEVAGSDP
jgi:hypothetical protein